MVRAYMLRMIPAAFEGGFRQINTRQIIALKPRPAKVPRHPVFLALSVYYDMWVANYPRGRFAASVDDTGPTPTADTPNITREPSRDALPATSAHDQF
jgi:hypothetical protein